MRSASLFAVLVLVFVLAVSSFSPVFARGGYIDIRKVTTNGDETTEFRFVASGPGGLGVVFDLTGDPTTGYEFDGPFTPDDFPMTITEQSPSGWVTDVNCVDKVTGGSIADFEYIYKGVIITILDPETNCPVDQLTGLRYCFVMITCTFTNTPEAVGGVVAPTNTLAILTPWLAVIGLVGCVGTAVVVAKKRH